MNESLIQLEAMTLTVAIILGLAWVICRLGFRGEWTAKDAGDKWCDVLLVAYFVSWPCEAAITYVVWKGFVRVADWISGDLDPATR